MLMGEAKKITDATTVILSIFTPGSLFPTLTQLKYIRRQSCEWTILLYEYQNEYHGLAYLFFHKNRYFMCDAQH